MKNPTSEMAKVMKIMEAGYMGKADGSDVDYKISPKGDKVTASVKGHLSAKYTKLAQNIDKIKTLQSEIEELTEQTKQDARGAISDLFTAEDEVRTRVVETVSFSLKLTKTPEPTTTTKWASVVSELLELQPQLIDVLETLKAKHSSVVQKSAALSFAPKESIELEEGPMDALSAFFSKLLSYVDKWCTRYDASLDALKAKAGMAESIEEDETVEPKSLFRVTKDIQSALVKSGILVSGAKSYEGIITFIDDSDQSYTITISKS